jgi:TPR repeat protein
MIILFLSLCLTAHADSILQKVQSLLEAKRESVELHDVHLAAAEVILFGKSFTYDDLQLDLDFDLPTALRHLQAAFRGGSSEAAFYMEVLLEQSLLVKDLDAFLPTLSSYKVTSQSLFEVAKGRQSQLMRSSLASTYYKCVTSSPVRTPKVCQLDRLHFYQAPFFGDTTCGGACQDMILHSAQEAALQVTKHSRAKLVRVPHLGEDWEARPTEHDDTQTVFRDSPDRASDFSFHGLSLEYLRTLESLHGAQNLTETLQALVSPQDSTSLVAISEYATRLNSGELLQQELAFQLFLHLAELGHLESLVNVGLFYLRGQVVPANFSLAHKYLTIAAASNHPEALYNLALMHLEGLGVPRNCRTALELFHLVTEQVTAAAVTAHANAMYERRDYSRAYFSYVLAAALGYESAQVSAGVMFQRSQTPVQCRKTWQHCMSSYLMLAVSHHNSQWSLNQLGNLAYARSDYEEALYFYSAALSSPEALFNLAYLYEQGLGVPRSPTVAASLYQEIIARAYESEFELEAEYPAKLALWWLQVKSYFFSNE